MGHLGHLGALSWQTPRTSHLDATTTLLSLLGGFIMGCHTVRGTYSLIFYAGKLDNKENKHYQRY